MIICSCNVLSDTQVLSIVRGTHQRRPTVSQIYAGLGCRTRCGGCAPTIKRLRNEAGCSAPGQDSQAGLGA